MHLVARQYLWQFEAKTFNTKSKFEIQSYIDCSLGVLLATKKQTMATDALRMQPGVYSKSFSNLRVDAPTTFYSESNPNNQEGVPPFVTAAPPSYSDAPNDQIESG